MKYFILIVVGMGCCQQAVKQFCSAFLMVLLGLYVKCGHGRKVWACDLLLNSVSQSLTHFHPFSRWNLWMCIRKFGEFMLILHYRDSLNVSKVCLFVGQGFLKECLSKNSQGLD